MKISGIDIRFGDCFELIKTLPDSSVDLILTDPPYGFTVTSWDSTVDLAKLSLDLWRALKPNGAILCFAAGQFVVDAVINVGSYKYKWIWEKPKATNFFNAKKQPLRCFEEILVFYKSPPTYNPQKENRGKPSFRKKYSKYEAGIYGEGRGESAGSLGVDKFPRDIIKFNQASDEGFSIHPTQKPQALLQYLIKTYTAVGDTILDPFAGSGSTLIAAEGLGRKSIGFEKNESIKNRGEVYNVVKYIQQSLDKQKI